MSGVAACITSLSVPRAAVGVSPIDGFYLERDLSG